MSKDARQLVCSSEDGLTAHLKNIGYSVLKMAAEQLTIEASGRLAEKVFGVSKDKAKSGVKIIIQVAKVINAQVNDESNCKKVST